MTVRAPGQECLTRTQEMQRELLAKLQENDGLRQTAATGDLSKTSQTQDLPQGASVDPVDPSQKTTTVNPSPNSRFLDIFV